MTIEMPSKKSKLPQDQQEKESAEIIDSTVVAAEKLLKLENPEFNEFAIRFMSRHEYEEMMQKGEFESSEAYLFSEKNGNPITFSDYLERSKVNWTYPIYDQTEWSNSCADINMASNFNELLKEAHKETIDSGGSQNERRKRTLGCFKKKLTNHLFSKLDSDSNVGLAVSNAEGNLSADKGRSITNAVLNSESPFDELNRQVGAYLRLSEDQTQGVNFKIDNQTISTRDGSVDMDAVREIHDYYQRDYEEGNASLRKIYGNQFETKIAVIKKFLDMDQDWLSENENNLRLLYDALVYIQTTNMKRDSSQYHMAVVIGASAVKASAPHHPDAWTRIKKDATEEDEGEFDQAKHILGAIALIPDKKLIGMAKELTLSWFRYVLLCDEIY